MWCGSPSTGGPREEARERPFTPAQAEKPERRGLWSRLFGG